MLPPVRGAETTVSRGRAACAVRDPRAGRIAGAWTADVLAISVCSPGGSGSGQCSQPDGGGTGIATALVLVGLERAAHERGEGGLVLLELDRQAGRRGGAGAPSEGRLDQTVLAGVIGLHDDPAADVQAVQRGLDRGGEDLELLVHRDAQRLEGALGGMAAAGLRGGGDRSLEERDELAGAGQRRVPALFDDAAGDAAGEALVAEVVEDAGDLDRKSVV